MAYPTVSKTYGFKPLQRLDGLPYAGAIRQIPVAAGYATAILNGDTVAISGGYLVAKTATNSGDTAGVLVGCQYVNSNGQTVQGQYYPAAASTASALAYAYVVDDPAAVFQVAATVAGSTTPAAYTRAAMVGKNVAMVAGAGSTTTGDSAYGIDGSSATTTNTFPIRVIDVISASATGPQSSNSTTYYEFVVKWNLPQYNDSTGV
jgi:hypothetical protein